MISNMGTRTVVLPEIHTSLDMLSSWPAKVYCHAEFCCVMSASGQTGPVCPTFQCLSELAFFALAFAHKGENFITGKANQDQNKLEHAQ